MALSIQIPTVGQPNSTEAVKVTNSLQNLSGWANGNIAGTDLSPTAGILPSQIAGGVGSAPKTGNAFFLGNNTGSVQTAVGHSLGRSPTYVIVTPALSSNGVTTAGWGAFFGQYAAANSTTFFMQFWSSPGSIFGSAYTYAFNWMAV